MDSNDKLIESIFHISRRIKIRMSYHTDIAHLSLLQLEVLLFLKKQKSQSMSEVAKYFMIEMPSATSLINKLRQLRLIIRKSDKKDHRMVKIALSQEGDLLLETAMKQRKERIEELVSVLDENDRVQLLRILQTIEKHIE